MAETQEFFNWHDGMSNTDTLFSEWSIAYCEDLDLRSNPEYIQLHRLPTRKFETTWLVKHALENEDGDVFFFADDWKIYNESWTNTEDFWQDILDVEYFNGQFIVAWRSGSSLVFGSINDDWATGKDTTWSITGSYSMWGTYTNIKMLNVSDDFLYVTAGKSILRFTNQPWGWLYEVAISFERTIKGIFSTGTQMRVVLSNGRVYSWDWLSEEYDTFWDNSVNVRYAFSHANQAFAVCWAGALYSELYLINWLQFEPIKIYETWGGWDSYEKYDFSSNVGIGWDMVAFERTMLYTTTQDKIVSWWRSRPWMPVSFLTEHRTDSEGDDIDVMGIVFRKRASWGTLYYSYNKVIAWPTQKYYVERIDVSLQASGNYKATGKLYTGKYTYWHIQKRGDNIWLRYDDCNTNDTIQVYYSLDWWSYSLLGTINSSSNSVNRERKFDILNNTDIADFCEIQFKIVLNSGSWTSSPKFYWFYFGREPHGR